MENHLRHGVDVDRYYNMAREGLFAPDARVELIDGVVIDMPPIGCFQASVVNDLARRFIQAVAGQVCVSIQAPLRLNRFSEPQPDLALLAVREDGYSRSHPTAADTLLVVEVSGSSLVRDRDVKLPLYAKHRIPEAWIVDLEGKLLHVYKSPSEGRYTEVSSISRPGTVSPASLPTVTIDLEGLLRS